jgi:uroporphyrinogen decarboxylase
MDKLTRLVGSYLQAQVAAGAQALQMFDSWAGALSPSDYRTYVSSYSRQALQLAHTAGVPVIHFSTGTGGMLEALAEAGGDVIGVDWRVELGDAWRRVGHNRAIQGNLDPLVLLAPLPEVVRQTTHILAQADGRPGHIFNLGHGVLPQTPVEHVAALVDIVHERGSPLLSQGGSKR